MDTTSRPTHTMLVCACIASILLLVVFSILNWANSEIMNLRVQWLWVSVTPILLALIVGGYVGKLKAGGFEFERDARFDAVPYVAPSGVRGESFAVTNIPGSEKAASIEIETEPSEATFWDRTRSGEYARSDYLSLVHVYETSKIKRQRYDITIFLMRHLLGHGGNQISGFDDVEKAEFFFGPSWGNRVFVESNEGGIVGVRTSAWGTFLAVCRVTFRNSHEKKPVILYRYIDFEMAPDRLKAA